jgi:XisI protein
MAKITGYQSIIKDIFTEYAKSRIPINDPEPGYQLIFDDTHKHYMLYRTSWKEELKRIHFCIFHIDIINNKLWIQEDATDFDLVGVLEERGVPKDSIVLAFQAPYKRPFTEYAVA